MWGFRRDGLGGKMSIYLFRIPVFSRFLQGYVHIFGIGQVSAFRHRVSIVCALYITNTNDGRH